MALHEPIATSHSKPRGRCSCGWPGRYQSGGPRSVASDALRRHIQRAEAKLGKAPNGTARAILKLKQLKKRRLALQKGALPNSYKFGVCLICERPEGAMVLPPDWPVHPACADSLSNMQRHGSPLPVPAEGFPAGFLDGLKHVSDRVELGELARKLGLEYQVAVRLVLSVDPRFFRRVREETTKEIDLVMGRRACRTGDLPAVRSPRRVIRKVLDRQEWPDVVDQAMTRLSDKLTVPAMWKPRSPRKRRFGDNQISNSEEVENEKVVAGSALSKVGLV